MVFTTESVMREVTRFLDPPQLDSYSYYLN